MSTEKPDLDPSLEKEVEATDLNTETSQTDVPQSIMPQEDLDSPERTEHIPTEEEVHGVLQELIAGPYTESRKREDKKGLYLLDVTVPGDPGEVIEYSYMRAGRYPDGSQASDNRIDKTFYRDGVPIGGEGGVARQVDGDWKILDQK